MKLLRDLPRVEEALRYFRLELLWSCGRISRYFYKRGYRSTDRSVSAICKRLSIPQAPRKSSSYTHKHSEETRRYMSEIAKTSERFKGENNYFYGKRGELAPAWKGGVSTEKQKFYGGDEWASMRLAILRRDGFTCQKCGFYPKKTRNALEVHHIIPTSVDWNKRLDESNLITLCKECHKETYGKELKMVHYFQDIVRSSWRHEEVCRNDIPSHENV